MCIRDSSYSLQYPSCGVFCAHHLEDTFKRVVAAEAVAAVVVEPVLGEGGFVAPPAEFFTIIQDICRRNKILLVADEVQTGFGRTGAMFASERYGITPDILVSAKSIADGLPLAAVTGRAEIMDTPVSYTHLDVYKRQLLVCDGEPRCDGPALLVG